MKKSILIVLVFAIVCLPRVFGGVEISRRVPLNIYLGEPLTEIVTIISDEAGTWELLEPISHGFQLDSPLEYLYEEKKGEYLQDKFLYIRRQLTLQPNQPIVLEHKFTPIRLGGQYFKPIELRAGDLVLQSEGASINVLCRPNGACESDKGENLLTCPADCPSGGADGVCDGIADGRCDPDCIELDPDCEENCGDGTCNDARENIYNCPKDCGVLVSGPAPGNLEYYEISLDFSTGQPRISSIQLGSGVYYEQRPIGSTLSFILIDKAGNTINTFSKNIALSARRATVRIPYSPIAVKLRVVRGGVTLGELSVEQFAAYCGDGVCSGNEQQLTCPADCPSGVRDGFCDGARDGICDADCSGAAQDPDCKGGKMLWLLLVLVLLILVGLLLYLKLTGRGGIIKKGQRRR